MIKAKSPPISRDSEIMVLGCMISSAKNLNIAVDSLETSDFYYLEHKLIFGCLSRLYKEDRPADVHIIGEELLRTNDLEKVGGINYLVDVSSFSGTSAYIEEYIELVKKKSTLRKIIFESINVQKEAFKEPNNVHTFLDDVQASFFAISSDGKSKKGWKHIKDVIDGNYSESGVNYIEELEKRQGVFLEKGEEAFKFLGIPTGFIDLDKIIGGLAPSNLIILGGRPGMGKTAFVLNVIEESALNLKKSVGIFSLEMSADQLINRMISSQSKVEATKIKNGSIDGLEFQRIVPVIDKMHKSSIVIDDEPGLKIGDLRSRARRMKETHDIDLLVIDYLQLLSGSNHSFKSENRQEEVSEISRMLKNLARELNIPVLCGCQLSRKVEERSGHRPMMSDLRESGAIEQDADLVLFLLRHDYYKSTEKPGLAEVIIGKNRHGRIGSVELVYQQKFTQFLNYEN